MMGPLAISRLRSALAASALLALLHLAPAPASAVSFTVFYDRANFGFGAGYGVSQTTAQSANGAGIPIVQFSGLEQWDPDTLPVNHDLDESTLVLPTPVGSAPATVTSNWSATNQTGVNSGAQTQTLYLVYQRPITNAILLDGQSQNVTYDPADVGLTLRFGEGGLDWVILQVSSNPFDPGSIPVYYPAVSLGTLANGATAAYPLFYTLDNPQVFQENFNYELGMPKWTLSFTSAAPIPEPSSGLLMLVGLLGIARARRKHS